MDLRRLRYLCSVVENGSVTKAAKALHIAQPPLSKRLQELEEEIGVPLLSRDSRQIRPTAAGYYLYQRATNILRDVEQAVNETVLIGRQKNRLIRVGLTHLYQRHFSRLLLEMHRASPTLEISVTVSDSGHLEQLLLDGIVDICLIQRPREGTLFDCTDFAPVKAVAVTPNRMSGLDGESVTVPELGQLPLIMLRRTNGPGTYEVLLEHFRKSGVDPHVIMSISQPEVILEWLESGLDAVAILPSSEVIAENLKACRVISIVHAPLVFFPSIVKLTTTSFPEELTMAMDASSLFAE
ncbi:LysR family transcriptional regulator [Consotaella aegiceratis]|uniref:LysR family transcriptional regulator n=1 Tax=Consotaella aegiceratis TaxID=3097961 RepID=UPI002F4142CB